MIGAKQTVHNWRLWSICIGWLGLVYKTVSYLFWNFFTYVWAPNFIACCIWLYGLYRNCPEFMCASLVIWTLELIGVLLLDLAMVLVFLIPPEILTEVLGFPEDFSQKLAPSILFVTIATLVLGVIYVYLGKIIYQGFKRVVAFKKLEAQILKRSQLAEASIERHTQEANHDRGTTLPGESIDHA